MHSLRSFSLLWAAGVLPLSLPRATAAAVTGRNFALYAGGVPETDRVDIYNMSSNIWSTANLSLPRGWSAATTVGSLAIFAGGYAIGVAFPIELISTT